MDDAEDMDTEDLEEQYVPEGGIRIGRENSYYFQKLLYFFFLQ